MALRDPSIGRAARAERAARRRRTRTFSLWLPLTVLVDAVLAWGVLGVGVGSGIGTGRPVEDLSWEPAAVAVAIPAVIGIGFVLIGSLARHVGLLASVLVRVALLLAVAAAVLPFATSEWGDRPAGDPGTRGWWSFASWGPLVLAGAALGLLALAWLRVRRRRAGRAALEQVAVAGVSTTATVTAVQVLAVQREHDENGPPVRSLVRVTLRFVDTSGTTRWAELAGYLATGDVPAESDVVTLRYDGEQPSNSRRMVAGLPWVDRRGGATRSI